MKSKKKTNARLHNAAVILRREEGGGGVKRGSRSASAAARRRITTVDGNVPRVPGRRKEVILFVARNFGKLWKTFFLFFWRGRWRASESVLSY